MSKSKKTIIDVQGTDVANLSRQDGDYISLTDMLKAKDGNFFISGSETATPSNFSVSGNRSTTPIFYGEFAEELALNRGYRLESQRGKIRRHLRP